MTSSRQSKFLKREDFLENEEPEGENETPKALLIDVVLLNIFKYLDYKDLKSCRGVGNTIWLRNSKKYWWSNTKIVFQNSAKEAEKINSYLNEPHINSNGINYQFNFYNRFSDRFWDRLWDNSFHFMKSLELIKCSFPTVDAFRLLIYTKCPNLERLTVYPVNIEAETEAEEPQEYENPKFGQHKNLKILELHFPDEKMPLSWLEILSHFPNIQEFLASAVNVDIYKTISIIRRHDPKMLKLKHIRIQILSGTVNEKSLRSVLLDPNLSFENLGIILNSCGRETLEEILNFHAKSLKELHVYGNRNHRQTLELSLRQPLQKLDKLRVERCLFTQDIFKYTPNVRNVFVKYDERYSLLGSAESNLRIESCKDLTLYVTGYNPGRPNSDLKFFLNTFPNVEKLETINLDNSKFLMICKQWTKLGSVNVSHGSEVTVNGLLGYNLDSNAKDVICDPSITSLKDLQSFTMAAKLEKDAVRRSVATEMKKGGVILKKLKELQNLKKFELKDYELKGPQKIWKEIFAKYSGN